jgi:hypothetical protein
MAWARLVSDLEALTAAAAAQPDSPDSGSISVAFSYERAETAPKGGTIHVKTLLILSLALAGVLLAPAYAATLYSTVEVYTQVDNPYSHSVFNCTQTTASPAGNALALSFT